ncbi:MAG: MIP/aquaporin family protein [Bacteroidota bacterium]
MSPFTAEFLGTAILILLGNGAVANVILKDTKGHDGGWITITVGWGMAVFIAVYCVGQFSGAHINPAVTVGLATAGLFDWALVPGYLLAQLGGAATGSLLVWLAYRDHFDSTTNSDTILATHATTPAIRNLPNNLITEAIGTAMLLIGVLYLVSPGFSGPDGELLETIHFHGEAVGFGLGALAALPVGLLVLGIGIALGGPTGYAINPARDLGPRIIHALLPIRSKGTSDWPYAWVPILGPLLGALAAAALYLFLS